MRSVLYSLAVPLALTSFCGFLLLGCSSVEKPAGGAGGSATQGMGGAGGAGVDTSCIDGSDGCVWSCAAGVETGSGDSPEASCDADGKFRCSTGSQPLSTCAPGSCARFDTPRCCYAATGRTGPPPCKADGFRDVCPPGSTIESDECLPADLGISRCVALDQKPCASLDLECHQGEVFCDCVARGDGAMTWQCGVYLP
jgi:hypothetical protein